MCTQLESIAQPKNGPVDVRSNKVSHAPSLTSHPVVVVETNALLNKVTELKDAERADVLCKIRNGLPFKVISYLEEAYQAPRKDIASILSISLPTLNRRKQEGRLHPDESDRVVRFAYLRDAVLAMMQGDNEAAVQWLHTPLDILGKESPMVHANTELGARDVEDLIGRIRHGVFS